MLGRGVVGDPGVPNRGHPHAQRAGNVGPADVADVGRSLGRDIAKAGEGVLEDARVGLVHPDFV